MQQLEGRVAVVTGAGSGIGQATSLALAARGCSIAVVDVNAANAAKTANLIRDLGGRSSTHVADVADPDRMSQLPREVHDAIGLR